MEFAGVSDRGQRKSENEDAYLLDKASGLFIVADGIGGLADGAYAAALSVEQVHAAIGGAGTQADPQTKEQKHLQLADALMVANKALWEQKKGTSGATCLAVKIDGNALYFAHAGDCKLHLYRDFALRQLNREHSLVRRLVDDGHMTGEEARTSSYRNVVERALGIADTLEPESGCIALEKGDRVVLSSDGLLADLRESEVAAVLEKQARPQKCCEELVSAANSAGGSDNITVVVVDL